jgi:hypothetical protein
MLEEINFLDVAQQFNPETGKDVYFYTLNNKDINLRKTIVNDFDTWANTYIHFDNLSLIVVGAPPVNNVERYTLVKHLENVVRPAPVDEVIEPETPEETISE